MDDSSHLRLFTQSRNLAGERMRIALNLRGLAYEYILIANMRPDEYRKINPQGLMPALMVGETVFAQSTAILEYLEEVYRERSLLPRDPLIRSGRHQRSWRRSAPWPIATAIPCAALPSLRAS